MWLAMTDWQQHTGTLAMLFAFSFVVFLLSGQAEEHKAALERVLQPIPTTRSGGAVTER